MYIFMVVFIYHNVFETAWCYCEEIWKCVCFPDCKRRVKYQLSIMKRGNIVE